jgi:hypothetical protein
LPFVRQGNGTKTPSWLPLATEGTFRRVGKLEDLRGDFPKLRGKDSNLDYLIQSQASYR